MLMLDTLDLGACCAPVPSIPWIPGAQEMLEALRAMGYASRTGSAGGQKDKSHSGGGGGGGGRKKGGQGADAAAAAKAAAGEGVADEGAGSALEPGQQEDPADIAAVAAAAFSSRWHNLASLLHLISSLCRLSSADKLQPPLQLPEGHGRLLLLSLLALELDREVREVALAQVHAATGALMDAFGESEWDRVGPEVASRLVEPGGVGPNHRCGEGGGRCWGRQPSMHVFLECLWLTAVCGGRHVINFGSQ
jgi:hypothetical protein